MHRKQDAFVRDLHCYGLRWHRCRLWVLYLYIGLCLVSILYCLCDGSVQFKGRYVFLYLVFLFNVLVLPIEPCFNSKLRFVQFLIVTLACSACISSARAIIFRRYVFRYALMYICILSIGSFFAFFFKIFLLMFNNFIFNFSHFHRIFIC